MRPLNILFSTTRQWNCGDEFILFGVRRLLDSIGIEYNPIIYNRHPSINPRPLSRKEPWSKTEPLPSLDNSFFLDEPGLIDYVIFAGSPEWFGGPRINPLLKFVLENRIRCSFLGVGIHQRRNFSDSLKRVLVELSDLIVARDPVCFDSVKEFPHAYYEVCPALFSAPFNREHVSLEKVGIVIQPAKLKDEANLHSIPEDISNRYFEQFSELEKALPVTYIAHYIDDLKLTRSLGREVVYSGYSEDYARIFDRFDAVVSTRVHGCGIASSLGIPNALIPHDGRYTTAIKFKSHIAEPDTSLRNWVDNLDVRAVSADLIQYRASCEKTYRELLLRHLSILD